MLPGVAVAVQVLALGGAVGAVTSTWICQCQRTANPALKLPYFDQQKTRVTVSARDIARCPLATAQTSPPLEAMRPLAWLLALRRMLPRARTPLFLPPQRVLLARAVGGPPQRQLKAGSDGRAIPAAATAAARPSIRTKARQPWAGRRTL
eukprot:356209-Chlamydomonas_euryale.AAC.8